MSSSYIYSSLHSFAKLFSFQVCRSALEQYCESYCVNNKDSWESAFRWHSPPLQGVREVNGHVQLGISHPQVIMSAAGATHPSILYILGTSANTW